MKKRLLCLLLVACMVFSMLPVTALAAEEHSANPFTDVKPNAWYYEAVQYARVNGFFTGVNANTFAPDGTMTRGMFVTVLGRMAGVDAAKYLGENTFSDVPANAYYAPYVAWAAKYQITSGTGANTFSPDALITRQQMAAFFVRYFENFGVDYETGANITTIPADMDQVASYAKEAVLKLWKNGLLNGDGVNFNPDNNASRAETATLCMRTDRVIPVWYKEPGVPSDRVSVEPSLDEGAQENPEVPDGAHPGGSGRPSNPMKPLVTFVTNGGQALTARRVPRETKIVELPTPYYSGHIFTGWYYDAALTTLAAENDTIVSDTTLYAAYSETHIMEPVETPNFASAMDVGGGFTVTVLSSDPNLTAEQVKSAILTEVVADSSQTDLFEVIGSNGTYQIIGKDGWDAGKNFRISLYDSRLSFEGQADTVREFNFTTAKDEVLNLSIARGMKYIPAEQVSNIINGGEAVESLSLALFAADLEGNVSAAALTEGSFIYNGDLQLEVGDVAAIYEGLRPDLRTLETSNEENGDLAYVEITAVDGNRISFKNADAEQVIFTPDVLPVSVEADLDEEDSTMTLENKHLDFSDDLYANMELDSQTTVDVGDFVLLYTGTLGENEELESYGEILKVEAGEETTVITYKPVTWEEIEQAMDIYVQDQIQGSEMLEGVDVESVEAAIEQHAIDSGFAEEAGLYLASLALATDSFTQWKDDVNINDVKFTLDDGTPLSPEEIRLMADGKKVEVKREKLKATISTTLQHFEGYSGLRLSLEVGIKITIQPSKDNDFKLEITVTGTFEQEMRLAIGASSEAIWKVWGIVPYIAEYRVSISVDLFDFTGIEIEANMITPEAEDDDDDEDDEDDEDGDDNDEDGDDNNDDDNNDDDDEEEGSIVDQIKKGVNIAQQIKDLLEGKEVTIMDEEADDDDDEDGDDEEDEEEDEEEDGDEEAGDGEGDGSDEEAKSINEALQEKYKEMLDSEAEWVNLIEEEMFNKEFQVPPPLPIIAIKVKGDFVVQVKASVSVGFSFEYMNAKRYVYHINVFAGQISNDVIDIQEETFEFTFYAMGHLGIKAGVELEIHIGIISAEIASVGFTAEAGVYAKLWGYFYYEFKYTASGGRAQNYSGALLIEIGAYLQVDFKLSAVGGLATKELTLVDKEWPFWTVGKEDCVQDFVTPQEEMPEVVLKQYIQSTQLSDDLFKMSYLDMKEGDMKEAVYSDEERFIISIDNPAFKYDAATNILSVTPGEDAKKEEGTMTITWIAYPLAFTSKPIQREVSLYWDNQKDGYVIVPYTNGGSYIPLINQRYDSVLVAPEDPVKAGYDFGGWYEDEALTVSYTWPERMPDVDTNIYAAWTPSHNTPYTVEHYQQILGTPDYTMVLHQDLTGTTDSVVTPEAPYYTGYLTPLEEDIVILPDGSAIQRYYYDLQTHTVTFDPGTVGGECVSYELDYGGRVTAPQFTVKGYIFTGWDAEIEPTMGEEDVTYTAQWIEDPATSYRVEYYVQQTDGRYVMQDFRTFDGTTGDVLTESMLRQSILLDTEEGTQCSADEKYQVENAISFRNITVFGEDLTAKGEDPVIAANGRSVIKVNYQRHAYELTFDLENGQDDLSYSVYYGATVSLPENIRRDGYALTGWEPEFVETMAAEDTVYTAQWEANDYEIAFDANGGEGTMENQPAVYDTPAALFTNAFTRTGYDFVGWAILRNGTIRYQDKEEVSNLTTEEGKTVTLYASWKPVEYTITYHNSLAHSNPATYTIESDAVNLMAPEDKEGYTFTGWFESEDLSGEPVVMIASGSHGNVDLYAGYVANPYEICFHANGGVGETATLAMTYDVEMNLTTNGFTRTGYTFMGWAKTADGSVAYTDGASVINLENRAGKVVNLYAVWSLDTYDITYDVGAGTNASGNPKTYTVLDTITLSEPSRNGYTFGGWYLSGMEVAVIEAGTTGNLRLEAKWIANTNTPYVVEHYQQDLHSSTYSLVKKETFTGTTDTTVTPATETYEGFRTPAMQSYNISPDGSLVVQYYYTRLSFALTLHFEDYATPSQTISDEYGAPIALPVPTREGYGFGGWYLADGTPVTANTMPAMSATLYAQWRPGEYGYTVYHYQQNLTGGYDLAETVTGTALMDEVVMPELKEYTGFTAPSMQSVIITNYAEQNVVSYNYSRNQYVLNWNFNGGIASNSYTSGNVLYGQTIVEPVLSKTGYTGQWDTEPVQIMPAENLAYEMNWTANSYSVTFDLGDGTAVGSKFCTYDEVYGTLPAPEKKGYTFLGWYTDPVGGSLVTESTLMNTANDHSLYAHWELITYSITYALNGGTNAAQNPGSYNVQQLVVIKEPTKTGHTFLGWTWDGQEDPVRDVVLDGAIGNRAYTANWQINSYKVTFYRENGTLIEEQTLEYGADIAAPDAGEREGYTFGGWGADVPATMPANNLTFITQWKLNTYSIHYKLNGGENHEDNATYYTAESQDILFADPTKTGYTFMGWFSDEACTEEFTAIAAGSTGDVTLYAKWEANTYTVRMHLNNNSGEVITQEFTYGESQALTKHTATLKGYTFAGWATEANGDAIYTNGAKLKNLTDVANGVVDLYGIWEIVTYTVTYQNLFEAANDPTNPTTFDVENNTLVLSNNVGSRVGYNFAGWYADEMLTIPINGSYTVNGAYNINIYAKWDANPYSVTFNNNLRDGSPVGTATQLMVYGSNTNLKPFKEMNFSYKGHTFIGWHTDQNATEPLYTDGQLVSSLAPSGNITLYAIWSVNKYTISYSLGVGATKHANPTEYNVWTDDIVFTAPTDIKPGYQFLGWYDGDVKVTGIQKSNIGDRSFVAKWAHNGTFTLSNNGTTFTVTRTIPAGTVATVNPQHVFYRTVNGTAIGGTADVRHFKHVGGEDVYLTFGQNDTVKTFTVTEGSSTQLGASNPASYTSGVNRYYYVELYKVIDTVNTALSGTLSGTTSIKRTISQNANYKITSDLYSWKQADIISSGTEYTITDDGYSSNTTKSFKPISRYNSYQQSYLNMLGLASGVQVCFDAYEKEDGYQHVKFTADSGATILNETKFAMKDGEQASSWGRNVKMPMTADQGDIKYVERGGIASIVTVDGVSCMQLSPATNVTMHFDASGSKKDDWVVGWTYYKTRLIDTAEPQQTGMAYMALCKYKAGDKVTITVLFNEIVNSASNVKVGAISGISAGNWQYVDGYGTNALTFTGTATADFTITTTVNNNLANVKPLSGSFYDMN